MPQPEDPLATGARLTAAGWATIVNDSAVIARYRDKVLQVPGEECWWWTGAVSGQGHGRFWVNRHRVVVAHRLAFALAAGPAAVVAAPVLGHRCDNPLCQRVGEGHLVASTPLANRREWAARRKLSSSPLGDARGSRRRARAMRDLARLGPTPLTAELARLRRISGDQLLLW